MAEKKVPYRQVELRRDVTNGWQGMSGHVEVVLVFPDKDLPKVGQEYFAAGLSEPDKSWVVHWRSAHITMAPE